MDIKSLIEKRNKLMVDAQAIITKETVTAEDRNTFDRMIKDADALSGDDTRLESIENFNKEQRATTRLRVQASAAMTRPRRASRTRSVPSRNGSVLATSAQRIALSSALKSSVILVPAQSLVLSLVETSWFPLDLILSCILP